MKKNKGQASKKDIDFLKGILKELRLVNKALDRVKEVEIDFIKKLKEGVKLPYDYHLIDRLAEEILI